MIVENNNQKKILVEGGRRLATILKKVSNEVRPGKNVSELNEYAERLIKGMGDEPAFLNYTPQGATRPYPASLCVSTNNEVVHGIPNEEEKVIQDGDILTLDMGLIHEGLITDHAITLSVGDVDERGRELVEVTEKALEEAINKARAGVMVGEIGQAVEEYVKRHGFSPAEQLGGHGLGKMVHESPFIPNEGPKDRGPKLKEGQVVAIEPIINEGGPEIKLHADGYTYLTKDGKRSAQFEHTIIVTSGSPTILTQIN